MKKKIIAMALAAVAVMVISVPAMAASDTTVSVAVTKTAPVTVSCEVPLKAAFVIDASSTTLSAIAPTDYSIKNTSGKSAASEDININVTKMQVTGVSGAKWGLSAVQPGATAADKYKMQVTVGGAALPDMPAGASQTADMTTLPEALYTGGAAVNIPNGAIVSLPMGVKAGGQVSNYSAAEAAADQFKIIYTIAAAVI